jgi:hypothetical protein
MLVIKENIFRLEKLMLIIHGGAFIKIPTKHNWDSLEPVAKTNQLQHVIMQLFENSKKLS